MCAYVNQVYSVCERATVHNIYMYYMYECIMYVCACALQWMYDCEQYYSCNNASVGVYDIYVRDNVGAYVCSACL